MITNASLLTMVLIFSLLLSTFRSNAALVHFGTDVSFVGVGIVTASIKSRNYLMVGPKSVKLGPIFHANYFHRELQEGIIGAGIQFGDKFFFILEGGYVERRGNGKKGTGFAGIFVLGKKVSDNFRITFPLFFRSISKGMAKRWQIDWVPFIGLGFRF